MALTYRNTLKGHVVSVPEPADIIAAAEVEAERLFRKGTKRDRQDAEIVMDRARSRSLHQRQTLTKMDESRRWERYTPPSVVAPTPAVEPVVEPEPDPGQPVKAAKAAPKSVKAETEA